MGGDNKFTPPSDAVETQGAKFVPPSDAIEVAGQKKNSTSQSQSNVQPESDADISQGSKELGGQQSQPSNQNGANLPEINPLPKEVADDPINPRIGKYLTDGSLYVTNNRKNGAPIVKQWDAANNEFKPVTDPSIIAKAQTGYKPEVPLAQQQTNDGLNKEGRPQVGAPEQQSAIPLIEKTGLAIYDKKDELTNDGVVTAGVVQTMSQQPQVSQYMQLKSVYNATADPKEKEKIASEMDALKSQPFKYEEQNTPVDNKETISIPSTEPLQPSIPKTIKTVADAVKFTQDQVDEGNGIIQDVAARNAELKAVNEQYRQLKPEAPQSFLYEAAKAIEAHGTALQNANFLATASDEDAMKFLENNYKKSQIFPESEPEGFAGNAGQIAGGIAATVPAIAGTATAATAATGNPLVGAVSGGLYAAQDMGRVAYANGMQQQYNELRDKGTLANLAYGDAKNYAKVSGLLQGTMGFGMGMIGAGETEKAVAETAKQLLKNVFADLTKKATTDYALGASGQLVDNYAAEKFGSDKSLFDGVNKQGAMLTGQSLLIHLLTGGIPTMSKYVSLKNIEDAKNSLALSDPAQLEQMYSNAAENGSDKNAVEDLKKDVEQRKLALSGMPDGLSTEKKLELMPLVMRKMDLLNKMADKIFPDQHAVAEIESIDRKLNEEAGIPLTDKETKLHEKLTAQNKDFATDKEGTAKPLTSSEFDQLNHFNKRVDNAKVRMVGQEKLPLIESEEDRLKLPDNTKYVTTDGVVHVKETANKNQVIQAKADNNKETQTQPEPAFRTLNMGGDEGKPETPEARAQMKARFLDGNTPMDGDNGTGETGREFATRVLTTWEKNKAEEANNTTVVTHSSVLKAIKAFESPETWVDTEKPTDPANMTDEQWKKFAEAYNKESTDNGDLETFKGKNGDIHVIRHGQTEDNEKSKFRSGNTPLTDKGIAQASEVGKQLNDKTGGDVPKIISSDLPRALHTTDLIKEQLKPKENADTKGSNKTADNKGGDGQVQSDGDNQQLPAKGQEKGDADSGGDSLQPQEKIDSDGKTAGMSNRVMQQVADRLGINTPESGTGVTPEQAKEYGRELLKGGADPQKIVDDFNADPLKKTSFTENAILNAYNDELVKAADKAADKGVNSQEYKDAAKKVEDWQKAIQPFKTEWSKQGASMQGEVDTDTGSFTALKRAWTDRTNRPPTAAETAKIKELSDQVAASDKKYQDALQEINNIIHNNAVEQEANEKKIAELEKKIVPGKKYTVGAKKLADQIRKLKTKPFTFKDENGNVIEFKQNSIVPINDIIEGIAKAVEEGGKLADAVKETLDSYKDVDWYKNLSANDKNKLAEQLADNLKPKEPETDIHTRFADKDPNDNTFTAKEVKAIWDYAKENYLDKGKTPQDMVRGVATDLGLTQRQVLTATSLPKSQRTITNDMYVQQRNRNAAVQSAKDYVDKAGKTWKNDPVDMTKRTVGKFFDAVRTAATIGHGAVAPFTHVGVGLFNPLKAKENLNFIFNTYRSSYGLAAKAGGLTEFAQRVSNFMHDPEYAGWLREGLDIDATKKDNDYAPSSDMAGRISKLGDRGFFELKPYRLELAKSDWNRVPEIIKSDPIAASEMRKQIAMRINHATGTISDATKGEAGVITGIGKAPGKLIFAPKLVASQVARLITDPLYHTSILAKMATGSSTPVERAALKVYSINTGAQMAGLIGALGVNAGLLALTKSDQKVNMTDPSQPDFMSFKGLGYKANATGGVSPMAHFLAKTVGDILAPEIKLRNDREGKEDKDLMKYARSKASPGMGVLFDLAYGKDYDYNVMPGRNDIPKYDKWTGEMHHQLTVPEYAIKHTTPIPVQEMAKPSYDALHDFVTGMKTNGASNKDIYNVLRATALGAFSGLTGLRIGEDKGADKNRNNADK